MWADSKWFKTADYWAQVRSTAPDLLEGIGIESEPPMNEFAYEGVLSLVVDDPTKRVRQLPTLYYGTSPMFADREVTKAVEHARLLIRGLGSADVERVYAIQACRVERVHGLFMNPFNRDLTRRRLMRAGVEFSDDPLIRLHPDATFSNDDWGSFRVRFAFPLSSGAAKGAPSGRGYLIAGMAGNRLLGLDRDEIPLLSQAIRQTRLVRSEQAEQAIGEIREIHA